MFRHFIFISGRWQIADFKEAQSFIAEDANDAVKDAGIIADAQRVEHYEISGYGTLIQYAKSLNHDNVVESLLWVTPV